MPINNFKTIPPRCPLDFYQQSVRKSQTDIVTAQQARTKNYGNGHAVTQSTASIHEEASTVRFNCGSVFDLYSPAIQTVSKTTIFQSDHIHTQAYLNHNSSFNYWLRSENLIVQMSNNLYSYNTKQNYSITADRLEQSSNNSSYSDYFYLQVGQDSNLPLYKTTLKGTYGNFDLSVRNTLSLQTVLGGVNVNSFSNVHVDSRQSVFTDALLDIKSVAQKELYLRGAITFNIAGGEGAIGADTNLSLTSRGAAFLRGSVVFINGGGRVPVNLDRSTRSRVSAILRPRSATSADLAKAFIGRRVYPPIADIEPYQKESSTPNTNAVSDGIAEYPT